MTYKEAKTKVQEDYAQHIGKRFKLGSAGKYILRNVIPYPDVTGLLTGMSDKTIFKRFNLKLIGEIVLNEIGFPENSKNNWEIFSVFETENGSGTSIHPEGQLIEIINSKK